MPDGDIQACCVGQNQEGATVKTISGLIAIALGAAALAGAAQAAAIVNGDFATPNVGGSYGFFSSIPGWVNDTGDSFEVGTSTVYGLPCITAACQNLEVNATEFGDASQTISGLVIGDTYDLSWEYGGRNGGGLQSLLVSFGGAPLTTDSSDGVTSVWTLNSFDVVATSTSETLTFQSLDEGGSSSYGNEITAVSISVPEPADWALMLGGFGAMGGAIRFGRRRRLAAA
ncbi:MAG: PEPxxWA-CTERM sorting domain-containing protein [Caulobacteraceae bacterium]